ncbi:MAG: signal recognition particle protein [Phycisphaeraceae bacterium]|nr:signal recognition particle protein [Phycisphaeraceae bacterium]
MFGNLTDRFNSALRKLSGRGKISDGNVTEALEEVKTALLEADVHYQVVQRFIQACMEKARGEKVIESLRPGQLMIKIVHDELVRLMAGEEDSGVADGGGILFVSPGPTVIMMAGLQGSGKTTTCGKLAAYLKRRGKKTMLAAADLQRPAAVHQLEVLAGQVASPDVPGRGQVLFHGEPDKVAEYGKAVGAAVTVCRNALQAARAKGCDVLIIDTAGRLHINDELMNELHQVEKTVTPHHIFLVIDAMTGQDAVNSAKAFNDRLELDGVILTKFDSDTRGGAALSVREVTGKPIRFIGVGEKLENLEEFHADRIAGRILGMGDVVSLVEKAQEQVSEQEAMALQEKMAKGKLTMDDFLAQLKSIRRMGSMKSLLGMLPGIGSQLKDLDMDDGMINRTEAIIHSMTRTERRDIDLLDNSRRRRISRGSGTAPADVSQLAKGFTMVSALSKQMSQMGTMGRLKSMMGLGGPDLSALGGGMPKIKGGTTRDNRRVIPKQRKRKSR